MMKFETIIVVDDLPSTSLAGGDDSVDRKTRFEKLFEKLCKNLLSVKKVFLILGDGVHEFNKTTGNISELEKFTFPDGTDGTAIVEAIMGKVSEKPVLLLMDYRLNENEHKEEQGENLAITVLKTIQSEDNEIYQILYSTKDADYQKNIAKIQGSRFLKAALIPLENSGMAKELIMYYINEKRD